MNPTRGPSPTRAVPASLVMHGLAPGPPDHRRAAMSTFANLDRHMVLDIQDRLRPGLRAAATLEDAAQALVSAICTEFPAGMVLARTFLTLPFARLPEDLRRAAWSCVEDQTLHAAVGPTTPILALLSTCGREVEWCDRRRSRGHAAIPLSSRSFVDSIPMVARMLHEMGIDLGLETGGDPYVERILGAGWVGLFHVDDARTARDDKGRRIIPANDFVERYGVRSVFGLGKAYGNGSIASVVVFATSVLPRATVESLVPIVNQFKAETIDLMGRGAIFR